MKKTAFVIIAIVLAAIVAVAGCVGPADEKDVQSPVGEWMNNGENYISINPDGTFNVIAGNIYSGTWKETETGILFTLGESTKMVETEEEKAFIDALTSANGAKFESGNLVLTADGKDVLEFKRMIVGTWETEAGTITFAADNTFSANVGANIIFGTYQITENGITFNMAESGSTLALGDEEEDKAEQAFKEILSKTADYTIISGKLTLVDANGKDLVTLTVTPVGSWISGNAALELAEDGTATFAFKDGNLYKAACEITENKVVVKDITQITRMMQTDAEKAFFETLESAGNTLLAGQFLTAYDAEEETAVLYFKHA